MTSPDGESFEEVCAGCLDDEVGSVSHGFVASLRELPCRHLFHSAYTSGPVWTLK